jgi:hypothetical protein
LVRTVNLFLGTVSLLRKPGTEAVRKRTDEIVANAQDIMLNAPKRLIRQLRLHLYLYCVSSSAGIEASRLSKKIKSLQLICEQRRQ